VDGKKYNGLLKKPVFPKTEMKRERKNARHGIDAL
jgi:hypothetical protein